EVVYIDRLESSHSLRLFTETGRRVPVHCTSSGKVLLAFAPDETRETILRTAPLTALTPHTISELPALREELARVQSRGWAEAVNERELGIASVAAPIRDLHGTVVAAISIGGPLIRFTATARRGFVGSVVEAAEAVSRRLGWSLETDIARPGIEAFG
ncbi:MAG: IclR family transcriptional regulator, partial [Actinomycetota bacterium]|nr:IclR family transcriptional regulator [Actinomycetota bacterium]